MNFNLPKEESSIIKVIGVGGGGSNAVNHMYRQGIRGVDFVVCNTDQQALDMSPVPKKIALGSSLTEGRGATPSLEGSRKLNEYLQADGRFTFEYVEVDGDHGGMIPQVWPDIFRFFDRYK